MGWRNCQASMVLAAEINARWPRRDRASDGTIGDAAHASRSSDHNPWLIKGGQGIVRARDVDKDGVDAPWLVEHLRQLGQRGDPRLRRGGYIIFNRRITSPDFSRWNAYYGSNPHTMHFHVSFSTDTSAAGFDSTAGWGIAAPAPGPAPAAPAPPPPPPPPPRLRPTRQEDTEMYWETPAPAKDTAPHDWPRTRRVYAFDPDGGWSGQGRLRLNAGPEGCYVKLARWWMRNDDWTPNNRDRMHHWDHPLGDDGTLFPIASDWQVDLPARATSVELEFAAPSGVHVFTVYDPK